MNVAYKRCQVTDRIDMVGSLTEIKLNEKTTLKKN